jgi:hypothetical protein
VKVAVPPAATVWPTGWVVIVGGVPVPADTVKVAELLVRGVLAVQESVTVA